jgi:hypothetical protein
MEENGTPTRPVRTLTVKNFSVIKEAKLEFGKITVLIGPQSRGKSLLCKLAYFLGWEVVTTAVESLIDRNSWDEFQQAVGREFESRFSTAAWLKTNSRASFSSQHYAVEFRGIGDPLNPTVEFSFSEQFKKLYSAISNNPSKQPSYTDMSRTELRQDLWIEFSLLLDKKRTQPNIYIPSSRAFFTAFAKSVSVLQNPDLDWITKRFAGQIAWGTRWKAGLLATERNVVQDIEREMDSIAGGSVVIVGGEPLFLSPDGRSLPLSLQSSGTQELLPMLSVLNYLAFHQEHFYARASSVRVSPAADISDYSPLITLEEPEANIFPRTQYKLVQLFAWLANDPILFFDWIITTHSPYVLTAFNSLIEAWRAGNKPGKREEVAALIPEQYWINENDFAAYTIRDGVLVSIFEKETEGKEGSGLIDGDYLDSISDELGSQFEKLLDIEYAD